MSDKAHIVHMKVVARVEDAEDVADARQKAERAVGKLFDHARNVSITQATSTIVVTRSTYQCKD